MLADFFPFSVAIGDRLLFSYSVPTRIHNDKYKLPGLLTINCEVGKAAFTRLIAQDFPVDSNPGVDEPHEPPLMAAGAKLLLFDS